MKLYIHSHACLEVKTKQQSLICDPWLIGSAYWRSWWNYPPVSSKIIEDIHPDFIYITHLHWDHFHGPTLRHLGSDKTVFIPKTPESRLLDDIKMFGFKEIIEINHGETISLGDDFSITSYHFYPFLTDSALIIDLENIVIFNCNDAKLMGLPLQQILARHPKIDFMLRSHSSANSRVCYQVIDKVDEHIDDLLRYSQDFADFAMSVGAKYAIPFASNHCYLHDETYKFNAITNYAPNVKKYFDDNHIDNPRCIVLSPGDFWDSETGFHFQDVDFYSNIETRLLKYKQEKNKSLEKAALRESNSKVKVRIFEECVFSWFKEIPWFFRRIFKGHPITFLAYNINEYQAFKVDLFQEVFQVLESWDDISNPLQIILSADLLNSCVTHRNWTSLGVSKRVTIRTYEKQIQYARLFFFLIPGVDTGFFPVSRWFTPRFINAYKLRWRELILYVQIFSGFILGRKFIYRQYLPRGKNST